MPAYLAHGAEAAAAGLRDSRQADEAMPMLEAIEQRATGQGVAVDARVERGRSYRHALARLLDPRSFDRVIVPAAPASPGPDSRGMIWSGCLKRHRRRC